MNYTHGRGRRQEPEKNSDSHHFPDGWKNGDCHYFSPERLRQARVEAGLTQADLARLLGEKSQALVSRYESGRVEPPGHVVARIAAITGKPRRWFIAEAEKRDRPHFSEGPVCQGNVEKGVRPFFPSFDPDEAAMPPGLQQMIDLGVAVRADELQRLVAYADPRNISRGARAAMSWTAADWLNVLIEERRRCGREGEGGTDEGR